MRDFIQIKKTNIANIRPDNLVGTIAIDSHIDSGIDFWSQFSKISKTPIPSNNPAIGLELRTLNPKGTELRFEIKLQDEESISGQITLENFMKCVIDMKIRIGNSTNFENDSINWE